MEETPFELYELFPAVRARRLERQAAKNVASMPKLFVNLSVCFAQLVYSQIEVCSDSGFMHE